MSLYFNKMKKIDFKMNKIYIRIFINTSNLSNLSKSVLTKCVAHNIFRKRIFTLINITVFNCFSF
jgi:hypothetical protein